MLRKISGIVISCLLLFNVCGCVALVAGGVAGGGTAVWLSGKLTQQYNSSYERTVSAAEKALKSLDMPLDKVTREENMTQIRSTWSDGKEVWVDIHRVTEGSSKVEVRVGAVSPDKAACEKILKRIGAYL